MRSSEEQLKNRGYITKNDINAYKNCTKVELLELLNSGEAYKRSIAVNLLSTKVNSDVDIIYLFCKMLLKEKRLYTKLELCNALKGASIDGAKIMVNYLGIIGKNQYSELPNEEFDKKSYPLPRDIIARTLAHMDSKILPELMYVLKSENIIAIREVIDSIGFICFYNPGINKESILNDLISCFNQYKSDDIIRWKIVRAFESFDDDLALQILLKIIEDDTKITIKNEAKRSLSIIRKRHRHYNI